MPQHIAGIERLSRFGMWAPVCSCGWNGQATDDVTQAQAEADAHAEGGSYEERDREDQ